MSRMRTDLRLAGNPRRSTGKLPPVRNTSTPGSAKSHEWQSDMVRGLQLHVHDAPSPSNSATTSSGSLREEGKKPCPVEPQQRQSDVNKDLEKLKQKILSLQKLIEKLREEIKTKASTILKLEEQLSVQEAHFKEQLAKLDGSLQEKQKEIEGLGKSLCTKDTDIQKMKEEFRKEKEELEKEVEEMSAKYQRELATKDEKLGILKMHMANALGDNSRERQQQLDELTRELKKVSEEADYLKSKLLTVKPSLTLQNKCQNCHVMEKQLQSKIIDVRDKEIAIINLQQVCDKMEKQLLQQDGLLREWAKKTQGKSIR